MNELIPIKSRNVGGAAVPTVNLRELHAKTASKQNYSHWVKARLTEAMATQGVDYLTDKNIIVGKDGSKRPGVEYFATLDTAKHIAMLERNEAGRKIRAYFIEAEKALQASPVKNMGPVEMARLMLANALRMEATGQALSMIVPINNYGDTGANGRAKFGLRRASFVARRHRRDAAEEFLEKMEQIDALEEQLELGLLEDGRAA